MARITPNSGSTLDLTVLEDLEPYKGILTKPKDGWYSKGAAEYGGEDRLTIDWQLEDGENLRDWISLRLGKQQNGTVSKLRMLLNALSDKPRDSEVKWFDSETMEWGYDDKPFNVIAEGMEVVFRGIHGTKQDGSGKFTITQYQAPKAKAAGKAKVSKADEVPF
jgi:hypothetical protein